MEKVYETVPDPQPKYRLFSHYKIDISNKKILNVNHFANISNSIYDKKQKILTVVSDAKKFTRETTDGLKTMSLNQIMKFNYETKKISLQLREYNDEQKEDDRKGFYNYMSKYQIVEDGSKLKIMLDPYTCEERLIIKAIRRRKPYLKKLDDPEIGINIYKFLNDQLGPKERLNFPADYDTIKIAYLKLYDIFFKTIEGKANLMPAEDKKDKQFSYVHYILMDDEEDEEGGEKLKGIDKYKEYNNMLRGWKKNYEEWSKKKQAVPTPIEMFQYRFEFKPERGSKDKLSKSMANLLKRLQPYDRRIILKKSSENIFEYDVRGNRVKKPVEIIESVDFGVHSPYLVSDILRHYSIYYENKEMITSHTLDIVPLTELNIEEFSDFIHNFKSACFEIISLFYQLSKCKTDDLFLKFNHLPFYNKTIWNQQKVNIANSKSNIVRFQKNEKDIKKILSVTAGMGVATSTNIDELDLLELYEPPYGQAESGILDFDKEIANKYLNKHYDISTNFSRLLNEVTQKFYLSDELTYNLTAEQLLDINDEDYEGYEEEKEEVWHRESAPVSSAWAKPPPIIRERMTEEQILFNKCEIEKEKRMKQEKMRRVEETKATKAIVVPISYEEMEDEYNPSISNPTRLPTRLEIKEVDGTGERRKMKSTEFRLDTEEARTGEQKRVEQARIKKLENAAIEHRFDYIIGKLEASKRYNRLNLKHTDVEDLIKKAAIAGIFNKYQNDDMVNFILNQTLDEKIEELKPKEVKKPNFEGIKKERRPRTGGSFYEKYLKYKAKYLQLKELLDE